MINIITLDGPAGVGKGTISKLLAKNLNAYILNSGEIFRCIAYNLKKNEIDINNITSVINHSKKFKFKKIVSKKLYTRDIDIITSEISKIASIRKITTKIQRELVDLNTTESGVVIAEGRDMGTVIFPRAEIKIFIWAKAEIRAKRRMLQINKSLKTRKFEDILTEITERDMRDMSRKIAPLRPAADSYLIDNSNLDIEQCFNKILKIIKYTKH